jgi:hypothetical protein
MDSALLTSALNSPELFTSVIEHFPSDLIEAELALLSQSQQLRFKELRNRSLVQDLASRLRQCSTWEEVEQAIAFDPIHKHEAWALLTDEEKERIKSLKIAAVKPLDPNCGSWRQQASLCESRNLPHSGRGDCGVRSREWYSAPAGS